MVSRNKQQIIQQVQALKQSIVNWESYTEALFTLEPTITLFFDKVLVMDDDPIKQNNRLFLCQSIANWSLQYMDLGKIVFPK